MKQRKREIEAEIERHRDRKQIKSCLEETRKREKARGVEKEREREGTKGEAERPWMGQGIRS